MGTFKMQTVNLQIIEKENDNAKLQEQKTVS